MRRDAAESTLRATPPTSSAWRRSHTVGGPIGIDGALRETLDSTVPVTKSLTYRFVARRSRPGDMSVRRPSAPSFTRASRRQSRR